MRNTESGWDRIPCRISSSRLASRFSRTRTNRRFPGAWCGSSFTARRRSLVRSSRAGLTPANARCAGGLPHRPAELFRSTTWATRADGSQSARGWCFPLGLPRRPSFSQRTCAIQKQRTHLGNAGESELRRLDDNCSGGLFQNTWPLGEAMTLRASKVLLVFRRALLYVCGLQQRYGDDSDYHSCDTYSWMDSTFPGNYGSCARLILRVCIPRFI